jgi:hypothetical protein
MNVKGCGPRRRFENEAAVSTSLPCLAAVNLKGGIDGLGEGLRRPICMSYGADELRESQ